MTLEVVEIAPHRNPSNKLDIIRSSRSNQLGKNTIIITRLSCLWQEVETTPSATTLGVVEIAPDVSPSKKLDKIQSSGSNLLGRKRSSSQRLSCAWQEVETTPSPATLRVVDIAPRVSPSNKLDRIRSS
jgi:hypothetical protein